MGKNSKRTIPISQISELPTLLEPNEELNLDFAGPLDSHWGTKKNLTLHRSIFKFFLGKNYYIYFVKNSHRISSRLHISSRQTLLNLSR